MLKHPNATGIEQKAQQLGEQLTKRGWSVTCAESCTGGGIGYAITSISGSSSWFNSGFITYSNQAKVELVGVQQTTLDEFGAVSESVVAQMATGAAQNAQAEMAVAVSGVAGPGGGSPDKPVGTVCFGLYVQGEMITETLCFAGDRTQVRQQTVEQALALLLKYC